MARTGQMLLALGIAILIIGSMLTLETAEDKSDSMRRDLLESVQMAATAMNVTEIKALDGSLADLNSTHYLTLKELMAEQRSVLPSARFVYLLGKMDNGSVFFYVDSEPADSPDCSPPGQIYGVPSETIDKAFEGESLTGGPQTDQWGVWMSGMVPIIDPDTGHVIAVLGIDIEASNWTSEVVKASLVPALATVLFLTLLVIFFVIHRRKEAENKRLAEAAESIRESSEKYQNLIDNSQDAVFIYLDGQFVFVSPPIKRILGYEPSELSNRQILDFITVEDRKRVTDLVTGPSMTDGKVQIENVHLLRKNDPAGALVSLSISRIKYGGKPAYMGTVHDLTATERAEAALADANRKLQLMTSITRHDILNQLAVLRGNLDLMMDVDNIETARTYEKKAIKSAKNIEAMIAFTKDYQNIGISAPSWHRLRDLVNSAALGFKEQVAIEIDVLDVVILADPLVQKVFHNLIDNAVRHGKRTTKINFYSRIEGNALFILVQDNGVGIPVEKKELIFDKGFGAHTGLGLFLTREVLSITGIEISEKGELDRGALFELKVPDVAWHWAASNWTDHS